MRQALILAAAFFLAAAPIVPAISADDVNPEIANCEELKDEATVEQATFWFDSRRPSNA